MQTDVTDPRSKVTYAVTCMKRMTRKADPGLVGVFMHACDAMLLPSFTEKCERGGGINYRTFTSCYVASANSRLHVFSKIDARNVNGNCATKMDLVLRVKAWIECEW